jgi:general secretion pathway protein A
VYQAHFQLNQEPFSIAPDPSFLYLSKAHKEALAHLMYGFSHGGFVMITGEVGTGKTTLLRNLLTKPPTDLDVAFVLNPRLTVRELLETLCQELGVPYDRQNTQTVKQYIDALNKHLLRTHSNGRSTVVIIDEAQNLSPAVLEQVRLLTNLETDDKKLLRIILVGQPELLDLLARQELRQLAQRITARYHLGSLSREDTYAYVAHRLSRAGGNPNIFNSGALRRLHRLSKGIPRIINVIADRALLGAYVENKHTVSARMVNRAAKEVLGSRQTYPVWLSATLLCIAVAGIAWAYLQDPQPSSETTSPKTASADTTEDPPADAIRAPAPPATEPVTSPALSAPQQLMTAEPNALRETIDTAEGVAIARSPDMQEPPRKSPDDGQVVVADDEPVSGLPSRPAQGTFAIRRQAYRAVFARWGAQYPSTSDLIPCDFAPSAGLLCLSQYGSWSNISETNLPVILELWDDQAAPYHAALTAMQGTELTLTVGENTMRIPQRDLRDIWYGAYVVLWETPPGYRGSIRRGDTHETVAWLRQQLSGVTEVALASNQPDYFDESLHDAVVDFQRTEGLIIDGVVGPATWIRLSTRLSLPAPRLSS